MQTDEAAHVHGTFGALADMPLCLSCRVSAFLLDPQNTVGYGPQVPALQRLPPNWTVGIYPTQGQRSNGLGGQNRE